MKREDWLFVFSLGCVVTSTLGAVMTTLIALGYNDRLKRALGTHPDAKPR